MERFGRFLGWIGRRLARRRFVGWLRRRIVERRFGRRLARRRIVERRLAQHRRKLGLGWRVARQPGLVGRMLELRRLGLEFRVVGPVGRLVVAGVGRRRRGRRDLAVVGHDDGRGARDDGGRSFDDLGCFGAFRRDRPARSSSGECAVLERTDGAALLSDDAGVLSGRDLLRADVGAGRAGHGYRTRFGPAAADAAAALRAPVGAAAVGSAVVSAQRAGVTIARCRSHRIDVVARHDGFVVECCHVGACRVHFVRVDAFERPGSLA